MPLFLMKVHMRVTLIARRRKTPQKIRITCTEYESSAVIKVVSRAFAYSPDSNRSTK